MQRNHSIVHIDHILKKVAETSGITDPTERHHSLRVRKEYLAKLWDHSALPAIDPRRTKRLYIQKVSCIGNVDASGFDWSTFSGQDTPYAAFFDQPTHVFFTRANDHKLALVQFFVDFIGQLNEIAKEINMPPPVVTINGTTIAFYNEKRTQRLITFETMPPVYDSLKSSIPIENIYYDYTRYELTEQDRTRILVVPNDIDKLHELEQKIAPGFVLHQKTYRGITYVYMGPKAHESWFNMTVRKMQSNR